MKTDRAAAWVGVSCVDGVVLSGFARLVYTREEALLACMSAFRGFGSESGRVGRPDIRFSRNGIALHRWFVGWVIWALGVRRRRIDGIFPSSPSGISSSLSCLHVPVPAHVRFFGHGWNRTDQETG